MRSNAIFEGKLFFFCIYVYDVYLPNVMRSVHRQADPKYPGSYIFPIT